MMTDQGPKVLEFNARFGDPETQVIMARMRSDVVPILEGVARGSLKDAKVAWAKEQAACVVLAARGYPESVETGQPIGGLDELKGQQDVVVFHAATARKNGELVTVGGRVLGVTALGANLETAIQRAYQAVGRISFGGMHYRKDIGRKALARLHAPK
jgi:phosphoribosylamine--glycine ligase